MTLIAYPIPDSDGPSNRIIGMYHRIDSPQEFIYIQNLVQMFLTSLSYFKNTETKKVAPVETMECNRNI